MTGAPTGLRRFARPAPASTRPGLAGPPTGNAPTGSSTGDAPSVDVPAGRSPAENGPDVERCEMCRAELDDRHGHVVDLEKRSLVCACRACYLLFFSPGAGRGRYRAVPEDVHHDPAHHLAPTDWDALQVPVGTAFFFHNSDLDRVVGCYPSPGGATECELDLAEWRRLAEQYPLFGALDPDVQAILASRTDDGFEYFRVPIDLCYALVGQVRLRWRGLDGGDEIRTTMAAFLDDLRRRSQSWDASTDLTGWA
jgi:Family of unknown function (DUF5947)